MTYNEIRKLFLNYFKSKGHTIVPSVSLVPQDPTLLFTVAGMVPWKGMLQGVEPLKYGPRVADVQKCIRAGGKHNDLEDVGFDGRHHTFFEMLGNWSFGDYFKQGAIEMSWDLLTNVLKLDPKRIIVTTHISDDESTKIWKKLTGKDAIRLDKDNWWSAGDTGPCGPSTEIFWDFGPNVPGGLPGAPDEAGRYVELWNNVFMQYDRDANGTLTPLPKQNVDTGAGLERWAAVLQGVIDNYDTDLFVNLMHAVEEVTGTKKTPENKPSFKIITDHLRAVGFAIADGVIPSNNDRGYVVRRILRRAMRHGQILGHRGALLSKLYPALIKEMGEAYPELKKNEKHVVEIIQNEENSFADMLENGMKLLDKELSNLKNLLPAKFERILKGDIAFKLFDTYGFPLDLTQMILRDRGLNVDVAGFEKCMREQKERSRADTKGTKTLWEAEIEKKKIPDTDNNDKYKPLNSGWLPNGQIIAIMKNSEFSDVAEAGIEVEVVLNKTPFYATMGGQVNDIGELFANADGKNPGETLMKVTDVFKVGGVIIHKGLLSQDIKLNQMIFAKRDNVIRAQTARAHTAAHLLQAALRQVLNEDVEQRGSKVSPDSVRFDFSFGRAMTADEIAKTENLINKWIDAKLQVETKFNVPIEEAKKLGAMALFGEKYGDKVNVVIVKNNSTLNTQHSAPVSIELCGGTHIKNTGEIKIEGHKTGAKINKEKSISSGIRRITMSVGDLAE
ncbi:MAG TPA: alanine--tRNA ligase [Alphaproteobacteria bacterium]|nr:alanine--tRNA ligase [Alphaproteobacteria bacterium]